MVHVQRRHVEVVAQLLSVVQSLLHFLLLLGSELNDLVQRGVPWFLHKR